MDAGESCNGQPRESMRGFHSTVNGFDVDQDGYSDVHRATVTPPSSIIVTTT